MIRAADIQTAYATFKDDIYHTQLCYSPVLSKISDANVYLKMEHLQLSGSFKIRGVFAKMNSLSKLDLQRPLVAASTGNHGAAFAYAAQKFGFKGILYLPEKTSPAKVAELEHFDVDIRYHGTHCRDAEAKATAHAQAIGGILVHPYNDARIITGQGSIGIEISQHLPEVDAVLAPVGGGGLVSGLCAWFGDSGTRVIGCQPSNGADMHVAIAGGKILPPSTLPTLSDATAGGIEEGSLTFDICRSGIAGFELIDELDIEKALAFLVKHHHTIVEPAAALPVAALLGSQAYKGQTVVLVLTGKKIDAKLLTRILVAHGAG